MEKSLSRIGGIFHAMEKSTAKVPHRGNIFIPHQRDFPRCGKIHGKSSTLWKNRRQKFHTVEKSAPRHPIFSTQWNNFESTFPHNGTTLGHFFHTLMRRHVKRSVLTDT
ncbi:MAG TPA: hypothetical protein PLD40_08360, partial [Kiritimatiellia bacterium]|nr:hypothetical protein [Kiritimatiellia bacterium]HOU59713.1 hypothetical protein [Kiritimatiellia bacterium]HPV47581.1 hypothetical protein [Kiritimatiellia bacterium]HQK45090.1 hypothetical protein [Kiritimatiellia bacterium]HQM23097.1 hypothetical protein [Kiritimatiellia bacterium]